MKTPGREGVDGNVADRLIPEHSGCLEVKKLRHLKYEGLIERARIPDLIMYEVPDAAAGPVVLR